MKNNYTDPYPLIDFLLFQSIGAWGLMPISYAVTVVQPGFVNRRPKRGSEATKRGRVWFSPSHDRDIFFENSCMKMEFSCTLNPIISGVGYVKWHRPIPYSTLFSFIPINGGGGGDMCPSALSYASDSGAAKICQQGVKARERSDRAGEGCGRGVPLPRYIWRFFYNSGIKCH